MRGLGQTTDATGSGSDVWLIDSLPSTNPLSPAGGPSILPTDYGTDTQILLGSGGSTSSSSSIPSWVWIGAAAVIGFAFFVGGRR